MVLLVPSPKVQAHVLMLPVEVSVNCTGRGAGPVAGVALKLATGGDVVGGVVVVTVIEAVLVSDPLEPVTARLTV